MKKIVEKEENRIERRRDYGGEERNSLVDVSESKEKGRRMK